MPVVFLTTAKHVAKRWGTAAYERSFTTFAIYIFHMPFLLNVDRSGKLQRFLNFAREHGRPPYGSWMHSPLR